MNRSSSSWRVVSGIAVAAAAAPLAAGPVWLEDVDAGPLPPSAGGPFGTGDLGIIKGALNGTAVLAADFEDMFKIFISDPVNFRASTDPRDPLTPGCADFDTQLFLFRPTALDAATALGVLGNNDHPASNPGSLFSLLIPLPSDGSPAVTDCGIYYLAISGVGNVPQSGAGDIFFLGGPTEISGPDGPGGAGPVSTWSGAGAVGAYEIALKGVKFASCPWDCADYDAIVGIVDFLALLSQWGLPPPCNCDIDGGTVGIVEFLALVGRWGPCPPAPPTSSCCVAHPKPGCHDADCAAFVCKKLPQCCVDSWGPECAVLASVACPICAEPVCKGAQ